jgi:hypothetical protein
MEVVTIKLGEKSWQEGLTEKNYLERARGNWRTDPRRIISCDRVVVVSPRSEIVAVGEIESIRKEGDHRISFNAKVDENKREWIGKYVDRNESRNPIAYFDESKFEKTRIKVAPSTETPKTRDCVSRKKMTISELFEGFVGDYRSQEVDWGKPVGKELW